MQIDISYIPHDPGVYFFKDHQGTILYIGKAKNLQKRVGQYFSPGSLWKQEMLQKADSVDFLVVKNESESLYLENNLIKKHTPFYNTMLKGGNGYTYIKLTPHAFPQIFLTRVKKHDGAVYIGPKHDSKELRRLLQYLRKILQFRTCGNVQFKKGVLCSDYHFGLCGGWCREDARKRDKDSGFNTCTGLPRTPKLGSSSSQGQSRYEVIIKQFTAFFKGDTKPIERLLRKQLEEAVQKQHFEWAANLRDIYRHIEQFVEKQHVELPKNVSGYVLEIRQIGMRNVFVLLNFYEGRLIDVVRDKVAVEDGDMHWMLSGFEMELGELIKFQSMGRRISENSNNTVTVCSKGMKFMKSEQQALQQMMNNFFDSYLITASFEGENLYNQVLMVLQERYFLKNFPYHMECVDISHFSGDWVSGGLSCFVGGLPEKKGYRKYKIQSVATYGDDYASLEEVLKRRFLKNSSGCSNPPTPLLKGGVPDVVVIDGGKGQLGIVKKLYDEMEEFKEIYEMVDFIALGEGEIEKVYRFDECRNILEIPLIYNQADKLLVKLRDEAHRFANRYRKQQMRVKAKS